MEQVQALSNRTAIITGAAGGLGRAVIDGLLPHQYRLIAIDIDQNALHALSQLFPQIETHCVDITDAGQVETLDQRLDLQDTGLDLLICLAGIYDTFPVTEGHSEAFLRMMSVNFLSPAAMIRKFLRPLAARNGRVIVVSSESYKIQAMFQPYMVSKAALEAYCRAARQELTLKGISLSVIRPGAIATPLLDWRQRDHDHPGSLYEEEFRRSFRESKKLVGKVTPPSVVAQVIINAAQAGKPKWVYPVNNNPLLTLITLIPHRILDRLIVGRIRRMS